MKKLITIDLDGTLLTQESTITDYSFQTIQKLTELGHTVVLATGRPLSGALPFHQQLGLMTPLITDNGGTITLPTENNRILKQAFIPKEIMHRLFIDSKAFVTSSFFCFNDVTYAYNYQNWIENHFAGICKEKLEHGDLSDFNIEPSGIIYFILREKQHHFERYVEREFGDILNFRSWGADQETAVYEIYLKSVSKSTAIQYLINLYGFKHEDWIAFGDAVNDIDMIADAHWGVAMKNASLEVKAVANDQTDWTNHEDGVANYLIRYFNL